MDYTTWNDTQLKQTRLKHGSHVTSVWYTAPSDKPLIVLVHGLSGDHTGMVPLAVELSETFRVALVDLPGHGTSDIISLPDTAALRRWFDEVLEAIEQDIGTVTAVCAHSFGCSSVLSSKNVAHKKIILLNPVPTPSDMYMTYVRIIMHSAHFWAHIYNWRLFVLLRGMAVAKIRTPDAKRRVRWVGRQVRPAYKQVVFQADLIDVALDSLAYCNANNGKVALVVCGMFDTTARQRDSLEMHEVFGSSKTIFLRGGHLLPIESPERVAPLIRDVVVK